VNRLLCVVPVLALGLVGCGTSKSAPTAAPPAPTVTVTAAPSPSATVAVAVSSPAVVSASPTPSTLTQADAGAKYLALISPANAALDKINAEPALPDNATLQQAQTQLQPYATALQTFDLQALRVHWPMSAVADMKTLVTSDAVVINDIESIGGQDVLSITAWENQIGQDAGKSNAGAQIMRADLGLPPAPSSS
jgi:hypothetical protein